jgi:ubiquitin carboxyl-terminal hydrolase 20/33
MFDIPGPIDNKHVSKSLTNRQSHRGSYRNDYVQVSENMWNWFHDLYGGGPAVLLREVQQKQSADEAEGEDEYDGCPEEEGADVDRGDDL